MRRQGRIRRVRERLRLIWDDFWSDPDEIRSLCGEVDIRGDTFSVRLQGRIRSLCELLRRIKHDLWSDPDGFEADVKILKSERLRSVCDAVEEFKVPASDLDGFGTK